MRMRLTGKARLAGLALLACLSAAWADELLPAVRPDDVQRLGALDASLGRALRAAFTTGDPGDLAHLEVGLRGEPLPPDLAAAALAGEWRCRMIKLGGNLPIVVYQPFRCRADADGGFEKLTGSQRSRGQVRLFNGQLVYTGTGYVAGETPPDYAGLPEAVDPQATPQFMPEVGLVEMVSDRAGRIIFPRPHLESETNLLVLTRG